MPPSHFSQLENSAKAGSNLSQLFFYLQYMGEDEPPEPGPELDLVSGENVKDLGGAKRPGSQERKRR